MKHNVTVTLTPEEHRMVMFGLSRVRSHFLHAEDHAEVDALRGKIGAAIAARKIGYVSGTAHRWQRTSYQVVELVTVDGLSFGIPILRNPDSRVQFSRKADAARAAKAKAKELSAEYIGLIPDPGLGARWAAHSLTLVDG